MIGNLSLYAAINLMFFLSEAGVTSYGIHQTWTLGLMPPEKWLKNLIVSMIWIRLLIIILVLLMLIIILFFLISGDEEQPQLEGTFIP